MQIVAYQVEHVVSQITLKNCCLYFLSDCRALHCMPVYRLGIFAHRLVRRPINWVALVAKVPNPVTGSIPAQLGADKVCEIRTDCNIFYQLQSSIYS